MKICESCVHRRIVNIDDAPMGVNPDNRRLDDQGGPFYLFCSYFYSFPSASMRLTCSHHTPGDIPATTPRRGNRRAS